MTKNLMSAQQPTSGGGLLAELLERPVGYAGGGDPPDEEVIYVIQWTDDDEPEDDEDEDEPPPKISAGWALLGALLGFTI